VNRITDLKYKTLVCLLSRKRKQKKKEGTHVQLEKKLIYVFHHNSALNVLLLSNRPNYIEVIKKECRY
jgi:hypothetical protein